MFYLDQTLATPADNLALDEALLLEAEAGRGGEVLRVWEWLGPAVVLGSGCMLAADVDEDACRADEVPVLRRSSGGGTVLLGAGCLLYTLVLRYDRDEALADIRASWDVILTGVVRALGLEGVEHRGSSDLVLAGRKFSGNAQQRKRHHLLHHGTLLYALDLARVGRYLRLPARQPDYRQGRDHLDFVRNAPLDVPAVKRRLRAVWGAAVERADWPEAEVRRLVSEKYLAPDWTRRR